LSSFSSVRVMLERQRSPLRIAFFSQSGATEQSKVSVTTVPRPSGVSS
jgi:hypothetical protein